MKILRMTASFGKLDRQTLELHDGLNILHRPNESGKSTWAAFLLAMFYGVDTNERSSGVRLAVKQKYLPWNGAAMEGSVELEHNGQRIVIERTSDKRGPMGHFTARDAETGAVIEWLTAQNCGETLLGVEREVFRRSAFIGQDEIAVGKIDALEQRLQQLIATGDESVSHSRVTARLKELRNAVDNGRGHGKLLDAQAALREVEDSLEKIRAIHREGLELAAERQELTEARDRAAYIRGCLQASEARRQYAAYCDAAQKAEIAGEEAQRLARETAALPSDDALTALYDRIRDLRADRARIAAQDAPIPPQQPEIPAGFTETASAQAISHAEQIAETVRQLQKPAKTFPLYLFALLLLAAGAALLLFHRTAGLCTLGAAAILGAIWGLLRAHAGAETRRRQAEAEAILARYDAQTAEQIPLAAAQYARDSAAYEAALAEFEWRRRDDEAQQQRLIAAEAAVLEETRAFAQNVYTAEDAERAVRDGLALRHACEIAQIRKAGADTILASLPQTVQTAPPAEDFTDRYTLPEIEAELQRLGDELAACSDKIARQEGAVGQLGDPAELAAAHERLHTEIARLQSRLAALDLAGATLNEAAEQMRSRFAPQLARRAAEKLRRMTGGRYAAVSIDRDLALGARAERDTVFRTQLALSGGTVHQLYLALRLAICELALPEETPLILDDALVYFDDARLAAALEILREESGKRQILLLTCQTRETKLLPEATI